MNQITIHKLNEAGTEVWQYSAEVLERRETSVRVQAQFDRSPVKAGPLPIETGDDFIETFYSDRWYNLFAVFSGSTSRFRGWYCNIARPAQINRHDLYQEDLALDLVVVPDVEIAVLDREEFERLPLDETERNWALTTLQTLRELAARGEPPFASPPKTERSLSSGEAS